MAKKNSKYDDLIMIFYPCWNDYKVKDDWPKDKKVIRCFYHGIIENDYSFTGRLWDWHGNSSGFGDGLIKKNEIWPVDLNDSKFPFNLIYKMIDKYVLFYSSEDDEDYDGFDYYYAKDTLLDIYKDNKLKHNSVAVLYNGSKDLSEVDLPLFGLSEISIGGPTINFNIDYLLKKGKK